MDRNDPSWRVTAIYEAALIAVMAYDWIISLKREYLLIWRSKFTIVTFLYFVIRYYELVRDSFSNYLANTNLTYHECEPYGRFQAFGSQVTYICIALLFSLRVYAVWGNSKLILGGLMGALCIVMGINLYAATLFGPPGPFLQGSGPCFSGPRPGTSPITVVLWLNPFIFDTLLTILLMVGIFTIKRKGGNASSGILQILVRDGLMYFIIISAVNLINVGFYLGAGPSIRAINSGMAFSISSVVSCRLILSLREHAAEENNMTYASGFDRSQAGNTRVKAATFGVHSARADANDFSVSQHGAHVIALDNIGRKGSTDDEESAHHSRSVPGIYISKQSHVKVEEEKL